MAHALDIACVLDSNSVMSISTGLRVLVERCARMLDTPRGGLFYAPGWGYDLKQFINSALPQLRKIEDGVEKALLQDDEVQDVRANARFDDTIRTLFIDIQLVNFDEELVSFTVAVDSVTVELLKSSVIV